MAGPFGDVTSALSPTGTITAALTPSRLLYRQNTFTTARDEVKAASTTELGQGEARYAHLFKGLKLSVKRDRHDGDG
jgi:hypothetical protein